MAQAPKSRPPFRADHVGSLLRPKALRDAHPPARRRRAVGRRVRRGPGRGDPRCRAPAGGGGSPGRQRWRVPAQLLLGPVRGAMPGLRHQAGGLQVPRRPRPRGRLHGHLCRRQDRAHAGAGGRRVRLPAGRHRGRAEDHHAGALDHAFLPLHRFCRPRRLRRCERLLRGPCRRSIAPRSPSWPRRAAATFSSTRWPSPCCAIPPSAPGSPPPGRSPTRSSTSTSTPSTLRGRVAGRHGDRRAHVPRQFPRPLPVGGRLRVRWPSGSSPTPTSPTSCWSTTRPAPATSSRCASCLMARASCSASSAPRRRRWRRSTT